MKAAADAWGTNTEEFRRGFAKETHDPAIVAATMAKPGVVLKRPVGSGGPFSENAKLPKDLAEKIKEGKPRQPGKTKTPAHKLDEKVRHEAALAFDREQKRRERARQNEEAARERGRRRREQAVARAERRLAQATRLHEAKTKKIERQRAALEKQSQAEEARWQKQRKRLETALRRT